MLKKHFKSLLTLIAICAFTMVSQTATAQKSHATQAPVSQEQAAKKQLGEKGFVIKQLLEKDTKRTLTVKQFRAKTATSKENLTMWKALVEKYKNDSSVDLSDIRTMISGMEKKLNR